MPVWAAVREASAGRVYRKSSQDVYKRQDISCAHPSLMFTCDDIEEEHRRLLQNGVIADDIQSYPYGKMFSFYDQDHQVYLLREA